MKPMLEKWSYKVKGLLIKKEMQFKSRSHDENFLVKVFVQIFHWLPLQNLRLTKMEPWLQKKLLWLWGDYNGLSVVATEFLVNGRWFGG